MTITDTSPKDTQRRGPAATVVLPTVAGLLTLLVVLAVAWWMSRNLPPGTTLAGAPVGDVPEVTAVADEFADRLQAQPLRLTTAAGSAVQTSAGDLGTVANPQAIVAAARRLRSVGGWAQRVTDGPRIVPVVVELPETAAVGRAADRLSRSARDAGIDVRRSGPVVRPPEPGIEVRSADVVLAVEEAVDRLARTPFDQWPDPLEVRVDGRSLSPRITEEDVDQALTVLEELAAAEVEVVARVQLGVGVPSEAPPTEQASITLTGPDLLELVEVAPRPAATAGRRLRVVPATSASGPLNALLERATWPPRLAIGVADRSPTPGRDEVLTDVSTITGTLVSEPLAPGFEPDVGDTIDAVIEAALDGRRTARVAGKPVPASSLQPADLGVVQPISTFTTFYAPGQSRVQNIHRIAELVDGTVIPPGTAYELNHAVGERTVERGFTSAGAILDGEFVSDVGGGVSQFATTFFNAAWFAGVELVEFKPHSFYFPRYPAGREATIDYPNVNLEIFNDLPSSILVDTAVTDDSVTVTFWSTPHWLVETSTGPRRGTGGGGFRITVERTRTAVDGTRDHESFTTTYAPQP